MRLSEAEKQLREMLTMIGLPERKSYSVEEVCRILGIGRRTFHRMILIQGANADRDSGPTLNSFIRRNERRVSFDELVAYIERNNTFITQNGF